MKKYLILLSVLFVTACGQSLSQKEALELCKERVNNELRGGNIMDFDWVAKTRNRVLIQCMDEYGYDIRK